MKSTAEQLRRLIESVEEAQRYRGTAQSREIQRLNPEIKDVNRIRVGQQLRLPGREELYTVKSGDTLDRIARLTGSEPAQRANDSAGQSSERQQGQYRGQRYTRGTEQDYLRALNQRDQTQQSGTGMQGRDKDSFSGMQGRDKDSFSGMQGRGLDTFTGMQGEPERRFLPPEDDADTGNSNYTGRVQKSNTQGTDTDIGISLPSRDGASDEEPDDMELLLRNLKSRLLNKSTED